MNLLTAIRFQAGNCIALTGAGGKTSALFALGREYLHLARNPAGIRTNRPLPLPEPALLTTTTHLHILQAAFADRHYAVKDDLAALDQLAQAYGLVLVTGPQGDEERLQGLSLELLEKLLTLRGDRRVPLFIEADGSRRRPLKAPALHEPVIPNWTDKVIVVAGLSGLYHPLSPEWVFRPDIFASLAGMKTGELIQPEHLARLLIHPQGGLKGIPETARRIVLLNEARTSQLQSSALRIADLLLPHIDSVIVADLPPAEQAASVSHDAEICAVHENIAGVILAAGASKRYGGVKVLLDWQGEPLVRHAARTALSAGLSPVLIITGNSAEEVARAVSDIPVSVIYNSEWESGQASSVKASLLAIPPTAGGAVFMLADQPYVPTNLIRQLVELHARTLAPAIVPLVDDRRSNPVLFDSATFPDFQSLSGDAGGRALFSRYPPLFLPWLDDRLLLDIDTPQDYHDFVLNREDTG